MILPYTKTHPYNRNTPTMPSRLTLTLDTNRKLEKIAILPNPLPLANLVKLAAQKMKIKKLKCVRIHRASDGKEVVDDEDCLAVTGRDW